MAELEMLQERDAFQRKVYKYNFQHIPICMDMEK
jgi:hypothetical protein